MADLISTSTLPGDSVDPDAIKTAAATIRTVGSEVATQGADVVRSWLTIRDDYRAPEAEQLFTAMNPVKTSAARYESHLDSTADALDVFAEEARAIRKTVAGIKAEATTFLNGIVDGKVKAPETTFRGMPYGEKDVPWQDDPVTRNRNNELANKLNDQQELLWAAERKCANAISSIVGGVQVEAASEANGGRGYGLTDIPEGTPMPWGNAVKRKENGADGIFRGIGVQAISALTGIPALVGVSNPDLDATKIYEGEGVDVSKTDWSWGTAGQAWKGIATLGVGVVGGVAPLSWRDKPGPVGKALRAGDEAVESFGKDFIAYDQWKDDPWGAAGTVTFNVGTLGGGVLLKVLGRGGTPSGPARVDPAELAAQAARAGTSTRQSLAGPSVSALNSLDTSTDLDATDFTIPETDYTIDAESGQRTNADLNQPNQTSHDAPPARTYDHDGRTGDATPPPGTTPGGADRAPLTDRPESRDGSAGGQGRLYDPDAPRRSTTNQSNAPSGPTVADVERARDGAPVDSQGRPVDHRNGVPLLPDRPDGSRAWHLKWDPEARDWVAENPGTGTARPGQLPLTGEPGSYGYDADGQRLPYANHRPDYSPSQEVDVWNLAKDENGEVWVRDQNNDLVRIEWEPGQPRQGVWDMGHIPTAPYRDLRENYLSGRISREQFLEQYRNPANYGVEHVTVNRSRINDLPQ